jgi:glycosyltransferase involved in cell wall biosynthesis
MRILYDHQVFSMQNTGGASRYHYELMRYLATVPGVQTNVFLGMTGSILPFRGLSSAQVRVMALHGPGRPGKWRYIGNELLGNSVVPFLGKMDVYHPTSYRLMPMVRSRRIVITHHDCTPERFPEVFRYMKKITRAKQPLYSKADRIICISEASRQDLLKFHNVDPAKTRVIHHGFRPLPRCPAMAKSLHERLKREYILYVGLRPIYKNFVGLLKAFCESGLHDSLNLLVIGGGPFTPEEIELTQRLHLDKSVVSMPRVSDAFLAEAYAAAKLFVYPSLSEGFGFPPLEAMSAGCPVLASNSTAIPEVCQDAPFYFDGADQECFTRALLRAVSDEEARRQAIQKGRRVVAQYSWEKCGEQTLALYRECQ